MIAALNAAGHLWMPTDKAGPSITHILVHPVLHELPISVQNSVPLLKEKCQLLEVTLASTVLKQKRKEDARLKAARRAEAAHLALATHSPWMVEDSDRVARADLRRLSLSDDGAQSTLTSPSPEGGTNVRDISLVSPDSIISNSGSSSSSAIGWSATNNQAAPPPQIRLHSSSGSVRASTAPPAGAGKQWRRPSPTQPFLWELPSAFPTVQHASQVQSPLMVGSSSSSSSGSGSRRRSSERSTSGRRSRSGSPSLRTGRTESNTSSNGQIPAGASNGSPPKDQSLAHFRTPVLERPRTVSTAKHSYHRSHSPPKRPSTSAASPSSLNILLQSEEDPTAPRAWVKMLPVDDAAIEAPWQSELMRARKSDHARRKAVFTYSAQTLTQKEQKSHVLRHSESANLSPSTSFDHDDGSNSSVDGISQVITKPMPRSKALLRKVKKRPTLLEAAIHVRRLNAFSHLFKKVREAKKRSQNELVIFLNRPKLTPFDSVNAFQQRLTYLDSELSQSFGARVATHTTAAAAGNAHARSPHRKLGGGKRVGAKGAGIGDSGATSPLSSPLLTRPRGGNATPPNRSRPSAGNPAYPQGSGSSGNNSSPGKGGKEPGSVRLLFAPASDNHHPMGHPGGSSGGAMSSSSSSPMQQKSMSPLAKSASQSVSSSSSGGGGGGGGDMGVGAASLMASPKKGSLSPPSPLSPMSPFSPSMSPQPPIKANPSLSSSSFSPGKKAALSYNSLKKEAAAVQSTLVKGSVHRPPAQLQWHFMRGDRGPTKFPKVVLKPHAIAGALPNTTTRRPKPGRGDGAPAPTSPGKRSPSITSSSSSSSSASNAVASPSPAVYPASAVG